MITASRRMGWFYGAIPFVAIVLAWWLFPILVDYPSYMLPTLGEVMQSMVGVIQDGSLLSHVLSSLGILVTGFLIGNALAIPIGTAVAMNPTVRDMLMPTLTFLQSIAGIAWVPLAIIWFGIGYGAVIFVIANAMFFGTLYNTIVGIRSVPDVLIRGSKALGANTVQVLFSVILPGAFVQILLGLRTSMAFGWRALVAGEMIAGSKGIGYMTIEAVQWYNTNIVIMGMIIIGVLWLVMDKIVFVPIENATVRKWGVVNDR